MTQGRFRSLEDPETLRLFIQNLREGIYITNDAGEILDANPACLEIFGVSTVDDLRTLRAEDLLADPAQRAQEAELLAAEGEVREFELVIRRPDGEERTVLDSCHAVRDAETGQTLYHGILIDISGRKQLESRFHEASLRDPLTGCYNRRSFELQLERDLHLATRMRQPLSLIMLDLDHFKYINDQAGHEAGDEALCMLADNLRAELRAVDTAARFGG